MKRPLNRAAAQSMGHSVILPKPPSVNSLFRNAGYGRDTKRSGRIPSKRYQAWKAAAGSDLLASRPPKISGPYELSIQLGRRKGSDLDNYAKGVSDLLVALRIVTDDSLCERLTLEWAEDLPSKLCRVTFAPSIKPGLYVEQTDAGPQLSLAPPVEKSPRRKARASTEIVAMSKLRDFANGAPNTFTEAELQSLIDAGLVWMHPYPTPRPLLTEAGWAVIDGPTEEQAQGRGSR